MVAGQPDGRTVSRGAGETAVLGSESFPGAPGREGGRRRKLGIPWFVGLALRIPACS